MSNLPSFMEMRESINLYFITQNVIYYYFLVNTYTYILSYIFNLNFVQNKHLILHVFFNNLQVFNNMECK